MDAPNAGTPSGFSAAAPAPPSSATAPAGPDLPPVLQSVPQSIPEPMPFASGVALAADDSELRGTEPPIRTPIERAARAEIYAKLASSHARESATPIRPTSNPFDDPSNSARLNWTTPTASAALTGGPFDDPLRSSTIGGWLLAWSPWIGVAALALHTFQLLNGGENSLVPTIAVYVLAGILPFIFAGVDRVGLRAHGHDRRPSWWWMILGTLVYFIARTAKLTRRSRLAFAPFLVWAANALVASVAVVLLLPAFVQGLVQVEVENLLAAATAAEGSTEVLGSSFDVRCPDGVLFPPFTCHISSDSGLRFDINVALVNGELGFAIDESTLVLPPGA